MSEKLCLVSLLLISEPLCKKFLEVRKESAFGIHVGGMEAGLKVRDILKGSENWPDEG